MKRNGPSETPISEDEIDEALEETFPASDPPQWTLGIDRSSHECGRRNESDSRAQPSPDLPTGSPETTALDASEAREVIALEVQQSGQLGITRDSLQKREMRKHPGREIPRFEDFDPAEFDPPDFATPPKE
jgi:hypothetical protein